MALHKSLVLIATLLALILAAHCANPSLLSFKGSNAKAIWANAHPMSSEELITKQAEMVYAADPGVPGSMPRVWAYRNTIKALNWYSRCVCESGNNRWRERGRC